ncbi:MAG: IspD/TarI family cytidylyltransferase [Fastidiosipilaceae bacterium]|jgi:2-C-methyl-D-erythritol 4-phosphate cytidylyltransferase
MIDVIYLAAGQGKRAGLGYPKQFARLGGKPIMIHGLEVLQKIPEVSQIIVVRPMITVESLQDWRVEEVVLEYGINKAVFVEGGRTRQESVRRGLEMVATDYVLIAEAVRPFITEDFVKRIIQLPGNCVTPWMSSISTVLSAAGEPMDRERIGEVQMPQKYFTNILTAAHYKAEVANNTYTDDMALVIKEIKVRPILMAGLEENIKITTPLDLVIAEAIYNAGHCDRE